MHDTTFPYERYRGYLRVLAKSQMARHLLPKLDASDLAQETLMEAHQARERPPTSDSAQVAAWLRRILANNIANAHRDLYRDRRDVRRERRLHAAVDESSVRLEHFLAARGPSPSSQALELERMGQLADALDSLPEAQRQAVMLRHFRGLALEEIATILGRTPGATAGLVHRGLKKLRERLAEDEE